jgi:hypothetical protein
VYLGGEGVLGIGAEDIYSEMELQYYISILKKLSENKYEEDVSAEELIRICGMH